MQLAHANMNNDSALLVAMVDILKQSLNRQHLPPNKNKQSIYTYIEEANTLAGAFPSFSGTGVLFGNSVSPAQCTCGHPSSDWVITAEPPPEPITASSQCVPHTLQI